MADRELEQKMRDEQTIAYLRDRTNKVRKLEAFEETYNNEARNQCDTRYLAIPEGMPDNRTYAAELKQPPGDYFPHPPYSREGDVQVWDSGAKRSAGKPDVSMMPHRALAEVQKRFDIGVKYGRHNWKKAMQGTYDPSYIRQFDAHGMDHRYWFLELVDAGGDATSPKGDTLIENVAAIVWNYLALLEYVIECENRVRTAFTAYPDLTPAVEPL